MKMSHSSKKMKTSHSHDYHNVPKKWYVFSASKHTGCTPTSCIVLLVCPVEERVPAVELGSQRR